MLFYFRQFLSVTTRQDCFKAYTTRNTLRNAVLSSGFSQKLLWKVKANGLMDMKSAAMALFAIFSSTLCKFKK